MVLICIVLITDNVEWFCVCVLIRLFVYILLEKVKMFILIGWVLLLLTCIVSLYILDKEIFSDQGSTNLLCG